MKYIFRLMLFFLLSFTIPAVAGQNVVDYYSQIQQQSEFEYYYTLSKKGNVYVAQDDSAEFDYLEVLDIKNGYILISDGGTGGGNYDTQIVLFLKDDGSPMLGIGETGYDPPYPKTDRVNFYEKIDQKWHDVTSRVWPKIAISDFFNEKLSAKDYQVLRDIEMTLAISLPQNGTTASAFLVVPESLVNAVCANDDSTVVDDPSPYLHYCEYLEPRLFNQIDINWSKLNSIFTLGDKHRAKTPWSE